MLQDMIKSGRGLSHVDLLKNIVYGTRPAFDFTVKYGVKYKPFVQHFGGHSVPRIMQTIESTGGGITRPLVEAAKKLDVDMHLGCAVTDLILNDEGRVIGVKVLERHDYRKENSGVPQVYGARKGVVAATGGFSQNVAFRMQQDPTLGPNLESTNHPGATGEVLQNMLAIGALPIQLDQIQLGPWSSPDERGFGLVSQFNTIAGFRKASWLTSAPADVSSTNSLTARLVPTPSLSSSTKTENPFTRFASPTASASNRLRH